MKFTPDEQAAQLRKPQGDGAAAIFEYMNKGNKILYDIILPFAQLKAGMQVLEIGQGNGILVKNILKSDVDIHYTGLDYSIDSVRAAEELNAEFVANKTAQFYEGLISNMPFDPVFFDRVLGMNIIYFWDDPKVELAEIHRVLKPGGLLVLGYRPKDKLSKMPFTNKGFVHYNPEDLESILAESGFENIQSVRTKENDREIDGKIYPMENVVMVGIKSHG
ncbi:MAG: class I SAM-dependent methyltransferase [Bacteroidetes bacterium]|nr:class I SAM-dependent methyltransferase [Bacteroidota bacterium]